MISYVFEMAAFNVDATWSLIRKSGDLRVEQEPKLNVELLR